jgi:hypothetical protein
MLFEEELKGSLLFGPKLVPKSLNESSELLLS